MMTIPIETFGTNALNEIAPDRLYDIWRCGFHRNGRLLISSLPSHCAYSGQEAALTGSEGAAEGDFDVPLEGGH